MIIEFQSSRVAACFCNMEGRKGGERGGGLRGIRRMERGVEGDWEGGRVVVGE